MVLNISQRVTSMRKISIWYGKRGKGCLPSGAKRIAWKTRIYTKVQPLGLYLTPQLEAAQRLWSELMELDDSPKASKITTWKLRDPCTKYSDWTILPSHIRHLPSSTHSWNSMKNLWTMERWIRKLESWMIRWWLLWLKLILWAELYLLLTLSNPVVFPTICTIIQQK